MGYKSTNALSKHNYNLWKLSFSSRNKHHHDVKKVQTLDLDHQAMLFGQVVVGPASSGKSTYCNGSHMFLSAIGRQCALVNLDPANDTLPYKPALDIRNAVDLATVMREEELGPNGGLIYIAEWLETHLDWLENGLEELKDHYIIFDCPGQIELFTHHKSLQTVFGMLERKGFRLVVINLIDSVSIVDPSRYISGLLLVLQTMLSLGLPQINVLSKIDLLSEYGELPFNLDYYTEVQDLGYLLPLLCKDAPPKFQKLNQAIVDMVEDFGLVAFETLAVQDRKSMIMLYQTIDKAMGYEYGSTEIGGDRIWLDAVRGGWENPGSQSIQDVQDRWIDNKDYYDSIEREKISHEHETAPN